MKILVTGSAGYIGSCTLLEIFRTGGFEVVSADNFVKSHHAALDRVRRLSGQDFSHYTVDLCDLAETRKIFEAHPDIKGIIHFAALKTVPESVAHPLWYYENNLSSLTNLLRCVEEFGVPYFIFSSSCSVYGNVSQLPVNEHTPQARAESPYAHTKAVGEEILQAFVRTQPTFKAIALRYFNPVGADLSGQNGEAPIERPNSVVPVITQVAAGILPEMKVFGTDYPTRDGSCVRDYVHVLDIADAHIKALQYLKAGKQAEGFDVFNLGSGEGVSVLELIHAFEQAAGVKVNYTLAPRRPGDVAAIYSDSTKARQLLGWQCRYDIGDMMRSAWQWQQYLSQQV